MACCRWKIELEKRKEREWKWRGISEWDRIECVLLSVIIFDTSVPWFQMQNKLSSANMSFNTKHMNTCRRAGGYNVYLYEGTLLNTHAHTCEIHCVVKRSAKVHKQSRPIVQRMLLSHWLSFGTNTHFNRDTYTHTQTSPTHRRP